MQRVQPDLLWIGLGAPRQEIFMAEHAGHLPVGAMIGVGAAFDFHSGAVRQAPPWIRHSGFEWLFRLGAEPRRLGRRYLTTTPMFAALALAQAIGIRRYPLDPDDEYPRPPSSVGNQNSSR
jgi:N-acetylglucosaminyldiphosphoundecaprenol N-acetyl-beta-D-mannosaminyltransferase